MVDNIIKIILVLGAIQGIILSCNLIFSKEDKRQAKYFLAALIVLIVCELCRTLWFLLEIPDHEPIHYFFLCLILTFSPNLWLYVRALILPEKIQSREVAKAHIYAFLMLGVSTIVLTVHYSVQWLDIDFYNRLFKGILILIFWIYYRKTYLDFQFFKLNKEQSDLPDIEKEMIVKWLNLFLFVILVIAILWTVSIAVQIVYPRRTFYFLMVLIEISFVVAIYWVGYAGFQRIKIVYLTEQRQTQTFYNTIQNAEVKLCLKKLQYAMETDKRYLDPDLTLPKLADAIKVSYKVVSAVLNQELSVGFNEYVNKYRVEEFKKRSLDPKNAHLTIAGLASDTGFNSLATFQRCFKTITGMTPKAFIKNNRQKRI